MTIGRDESTASNWVSNPPNVQSRVSRHEITSVGSNLGKTVKRVQARARETLNLS